MNKLAILFSCTLLAACSPAVAPTPPLAGARIGGPFTLTDENGKKVSDRDFAGRYRIVYFGYTFCPDVCPTDVANLMHGWQLLGKTDPARANKIQSMFITVDPARDTPDTLKSFTANFDPRLIGLTGTPEAIAAVTKAYGVAVSVQKPTAPGVYFVDHTNAAYLMDPDGKPLALLPSDGTPKAIADELSKWVK
ncbi:SCO family protein [Sphingomonas paeninsulae]|jgi:protein SCO1/2|uniref:SCO family protein n=1 Tax=Sphingomonas paeninsulae TaxID=2319844 RepID=A0A494TH29_SPHPE|nr:SCO family protein [Sphingomonas paeninsulae]AYJ86622.1 SCO family protein [Sphingomonas paeninsulae]